MTELWTPSDDLLKQDPIALQKIKTPFEAVDLAAHGIKLPDIEDDEANEAAACVVLAAQDAREDAAATESGEVGDDEDVDDPEDLEDVPSDT